MSIPINPLSVYNSSRYYHVLAVCDSNTTSSEIMGSNNAYTWQHPIDVVDSELYDLMGKYAPKTTDSGGKYCILINGSSDADLVIENLTYFSTIAGVAVDNDMASSIACEGKMQITEPYGVNFLDAITLACMSLQVAPVSAVFVLKTFFIGYTDTGDVTTISNVAPIELTIFDMQLQITEAGGSYNVEFVAMSGGTARLPQYSKVGSGLKFSVLSSEQTPNVSLRTAFNTLQNRLATLYQQQFNCLATSIEYAQSEAGLQSDITKQLTRLDFVITLDEMYDESYVVSDSPNLYKDVGLCEEGIYVDAGPNASIESVIRSIMQRSPQVLQDTNGTRPGNLKFAENTRLTYRIRAVNRNERDEDGSIVQVMHYHVYPIRISESMNGTEVDSLISNGANLLEFNYIYTGKNVDILKFDISLPYGLQYLATASVTNSFTNQLELVGSRTTTVPNVMQTVYGSGESSRTVVPFSTQVSNKAMMNSQYPISSTAALYSMSEVAAVNQPEVSIQIIGNPVLMSMINDSHNTDFINNEDDITSSETYDMDVPLDQQRALLDWQTVPTFVKININMPINNDPLSMLTQHSYTRPFWYQGLYRLISVENVFANGSFIQNLVMITQPKGLISEDDMLRTETFQRALTTSTQNCYDNVVNATTGQNQTAYVYSRPFAEPNSDSSKVTDHTVEVAVGNGEMCRVTDWNKASDEVKRAILTAADEYAVSPVTLAMFAWCESRFNPTAASKSGSASGLFQHINDTWMGLVRQGKINGIPTDTPKQSALSMRFKPLYSARGGAAYIKEMIRLIKTTDPGEIYLGYFLGPVPARKVVAGCSAGMTVRAALGDEMFGKYQRANPSIIKNGTSCCELIQWAKSRMAAALKGKCSGTEQAPANAGTSSTDKWAETNQRKNDSSGGEWNNQSEAGISSDEPISATSSVNPISRTGAEAISAATDPTAITKQSNIACNGERLPPSSNMTGSNANTN